MSLFRKALELYSLQFTKFERRIKSDRKELPFQGFFSFIFCSVIIGGLAGIIVGIIEGNIGIIISNLCLIAMALLGPFILNKGINHKE